MPELEQIIEKFSELKQIVYTKKRNGTYERLRIRSEDGGTVSGVYIFWWIGDLSLLTMGKTKIYVKGNEIKKDLEAYYSNHKCLEIIKSKSKKYLKYSYEFTVDKNIYDQFNMLPLYIGKSTNLDQRIQQHILNGTPDYGRLVNENELIYKKTTSCQLRSHLEYILCEDSRGRFRKPEERFSLALENVRVQFYKNDICDFGERFYLEDELIGRLKPWFNIDSER